VFPYALIALGANLPSKFGTPLQTLEAAINEIESEGIRITSRSRWFRSEPVPASSQDWYINGVIAVDTDLAPEALLAVLHRIEDRFGRIRGERNAARVLDLDLIAFGDLVRNADSPPQLPHPRMHDRAFVLLPLADVAPDWVHPVTGLSLSRLLDDLPTDQIAEPLEAAAGG